MDFQQSRKIVEYHARLLLDESRVARYEEAINAIVKPGDVVLDIGTGSGILALLACKAGADRVYAAESLATIDIARHLRDANGLKDKVVLIKESSRSMTLPEQVDVVVTETLWNFGPGEGLLTSVIDARERFLRPGGTIIPADVTMMCAPVENPVMYSLLSVWADNRFGVDLGAMRSSAANNVYNCDIGPEMLLAGSSDLITISTLSAESSDVSAQTSFVIAKAGTMHGIGGWFRSQLSDGVTLTNQPPSVTPSWHHAFLPAREPLELSEGSTVELSVTVGADDAAWSWQISVDGSEATSSSSVLGFPMSPSNLRLRAPKGTAKRSAVGDASLTVLEAMGGTLTTAEIAESLHARFPSQFRSVEHATAFAGDIIEEYGAS